MRFRVVGKKIKWPEIIADEKKEVKRDERLKSVTYLNPADLDESVFVFDVFGKVFGQGIFAGSFFCEVVLFLRCELFGDLIFGFMKVV